MREKSVLGWTLGAVLSALAALAAEKPAYDSAAALLGAAAFKDYCVACHGSGGRGDGPLASRLRYAPADLTAIARHNAGTFPFEKVRRIVDGRKPVKGHQGAEMPAWGDALKDAKDSYDERRVRSQIETLVQFLASIQQDPER